MSYVTPEGTELVDAVWEGWGLGLKYAPTRVTFSADTYHINCILPTMYAALQEVDVMDPWSYDSDEAPKLIGYFDNTEDGDLCAECETSL